MHTVIMNIIYIILQNVSSKQTNHDVTYHILKLNLIDLQREIDKLS